MRHVDPRRHRILFAIGIGLIIANVPVGWGGALGFAALAAFTKDRYWLLVAVGAYVFSWVLLGLGVLIAGKTGLERARRILRRRRRLKELLLGRRLRREAHDADEAPPP